MAEKFIRFIDSNLYVVYKTLQDNINTFCYQYSLFDKTNHPLYGFSYKSLTTLEEELNISRKVISEHILHLQELGYIKVERFKDISQIIFKRAEEFNKIIPKYNSYCEKTESFKKINIDHFYYSFSPDKMFISFCDTVYPPTFIDFLLFFLKEIRKNIRKKNKSANITYDFLTFCLSPKFQDNYVLGFENLKTLVIKNSERICKDFDLDFKDTEVYYNAVNNKFTTVGFTFERDFTKSKMKMKSMFKYIPDIQVLGRTFQKPQDDFREVINYICFEYGLSIFAQTVKPTEDIFYMLMECTLLDVPKNKVLEAWLKFKEKYVAWKEMPILHLVRSLRLFVYHLTSEADDVIVKDENKIKNEKYILQKRDNPEDVPVPFIFKGHSCYTDIKKSKFFRENIIVDPMSGKEVSPFFLYPDYIGRKSDYLPPWEEILGKADTEEGKELKSLYEAVKPLIRDFIEEAICDNILDVNLLGN